MKAKVENSILMSFAILVHEGKGRIYFFQKCCYSHVFCNLIFEVVFTLHNLAFGYLDLISIKNFCKA